jgi:hypothetical protein
MKRDGTADSDGKGAGKNVAALPNPAIDARSAVQFLRNVGFDVVEGADRARMTERLLQFGRRRPSFLPWLGGMIVGAATPVSNPSPERRSANNKSARWARNRTIRQEKIQKKEKANQRGLVSVTEKTNRISGISGGDAGSCALGNLDAHRDRRNHYRGGNLVVHAGYGGGHAIPGNGESCRGQRVADRSAHRPRLQMPGRRTRQGVLRGRDRDRGYRRAVKTLIGIRMPAGIRTASG